MASLKRSARMQRPKVEGKIDTSTDGVLELSVTVGYLASNVHREELGKLERLLRDHCDAGVVALERGDMEQHLHFQMVCRARVKSARAFGILVRKYMEWYGKKNMSPVGKVMCKVLSNRLIHTWKGMIGYCLKDCGRVHFETAMFNISDDDVVAGKTLHSIYGKANLKSRVVITNKNIGERAYVWYKYKETRQLTATLLSTLIDMINSAMFIPASSWIIPFAGQGMDHRRMNLFWKCLTDPTNVDRAEVADVFIRKREYVKGRYWDEDQPQPTVLNAAEEYVYEASPPSVKLEPVSSPSATRVIPRTLDVPPFSRSSSVTVKHEVLSKHISSNSNTKLFKEVTFVQRPTKNVTFSDQLGDFVPLQNIAPLPIDVSLPTTNVVSGNDDTKVSDAAFWDSLTNTSVVGMAGYKLGSRIWKGEDPLVKSGEDETEDCKEPVIILLSSDSEDEEPVPKKRLKPADVFEDRRGSIEIAPVYNRTEELVSARVKLEPGLCEWRVVNAVGNV